ncbi:MAG: NAD-dependent epimerase/dehydratase family protein, partial [Clostridiales bacterium]|nr:NAD-dependent epimerase/dehydratase family protein [Clostridiales bacterium]
MKLLILGGSGFVSGRLAQIAIAQGHEVWCVTRGNRPIPEDVHALTCDAHDPAALRAALASAQLQWDAALDCICRDAASASVD